MHTDTQEYWSANRVWIEAMDDILSFGTESEPRGMPIKEIIGNSMTFDMSQPIVTFKDREINWRFAFGEAWWIVSGSNDVEGPRGITQFMKGYKRFSDDGVFMNGAYGPKVVDQLTWIVDTLEKDQSSRQAVLNIWREKPAPSKDIPCTLNHQYFIRNGRLEVVVNMRSSDVVWGFCYDSFTFTMMAKMVQILLRQRGINVSLGTMTINQGSAHIYKDFWEKADAWARLSPYDPEAIDPKWTALNFDIEKPFESRQEFLDWLYETAISF